MKITALHIYPVKSLGGFSVKSSILTKKGLQYDRNWMILDNDGTFITQRTVPAMTQILTDIKDGRLHFRHRPTGKTASIPIKKSYGENFPSKVWSNDCEVQRVGDEIDAYLTEVLGQKCSLVFLPEENIRTKTTDEGTVKNIASFADKSPLLIANEASMADFNKRLDKAVPLNRFRANVIFTGTKAFEEDNWAQIKLAGVECNHVELCGRCPLINTDQFTGAVQSEPLKVLTTFRRDATDRQVKFGVRFSCEVPAGAAPVISVGDDFEVI
jgi:uncharacterized protein YcbX